MNQHINSRNIATVAKLVAAGKPVPQTLAWAADFDRNHAAGLATAKATPFVTIWAATAAHRASK